MIDSPGLAMQLAGVARELIRCGHDVACVSTPSLAALSARCGLRRLDGGDDGAGFTLRQWGAPRATVAELLYLHAAVRAFAPDVILASPFGYGPAIFAELAELPLVILGGVTFTWATGAFAREEGARLFHAGRVALGLPALPALGRTGHPPWLGDAYLLQSTPALSGPVSCSDRVHWVGDCTWELPAPPDRELAAWVQAAQGRGDRVVYAQSGREFGAAAFDDRLIEAAARLGLAVAIDTARSDQPRSHRSDRAFVQPGLPRSQILPHASLVVGSGHPTSVLAAATRALPLILLTHGSGTEETAAASVAAGIAFAAPLTTVTVDGLAALIGDAIDTPEMASAAAMIADDLANEGGRARAAELVIETAVARRAGQRRAI